MTHKPPQGIDAELPTVDEIAEAMADARWWRGSWAQLGDHARNVMRQGAEGVRAMLLKRAAPPDPRKDLEALLEGPYNGQSPFVQAIERGYEKWESEGNCRELGCGCVTVFIFDEVQRWLAEMRGAKEMRGK